MRTRILIPIALSLLAACSASRPTAHVIINNDSDKDIPLNLSISNKKDMGQSPMVFNINIKPGLQEMAPEKLSRGFYSVSAETSNGLVSTSRNVNFDSDRWIIINFMHNDSLNIQRKYGFVDTTMLKKVNGKYTGMDMYSENRRPFTSSDIARTASLK
ncbi:MAG: hypothetical protein JWQ30_1076 [Sediminibacterium sp.]|nr:hypothetical protein [Sediminibacterium sp.]